VLSVHVWGPSNKEAVCFDQILGGIARIAMGSRNNPIEFHHPVLDQIYEIYEPSNHTFPQCVAQVATDPHLKFNHHLAPYQRSAIKHKFWMLGAQVTSTVTGLS